MSSQPPQPSFGVIMLRHMNSEQSAMYWAECYKRIRRFYPETPIVIIDDNSDSVYLDAVKNKEAALHKCTILRTPFQKRGELLPYHYYIINNWFANALIIHDSVFINKYIDFETIATGDLMSETGCLFLWQFDRGSLYDNRPHDISLINNINNIARRSDLLNVYLNPTLWVGCFGVMSFIRRSFLLEINEKYKVSDLIPHVTTRQSRMAMERVFACMVFDLWLQRKRQNANKNKIMQHRAAPPVSLMGNIHAYCRWGYSYANYISNHDNYATGLPIIKVWSGR